MDAINGKRGRNELLDGFLVQRNLLACCSTNVTEVYAGMRPHDAKATAECLRSLLTLLTDNRKDFPMPELQFYDLS